MIGRTAALLADLAVDLTPAGWRLVPRPGLDQRRAREFLARDLDALHDVAEGYTGPLKVQAAGPWTLAAGLERVRGERAVVDPGARRDLGPSPGGGAGGGGGGGGGPPPRAPAAPAPGPAGGGGRPPPPPSPPGCPPRRSSCSSTSRRYPPSCRARCRRPAASASSRPSRRTWSS